MEIVVLNGSPRRGGNTDALVMSFMHGAFESGNAVIVNNVTDFEVRPCIGCNRCFKSDEHLCWQDDHMQFIINQLRSADMLVIASPVYFYSISAQLKALIDRLHNPVRDTFKIKQIALLCTAASSNPRAFDAIKTQYELLCEYFKLEDVGQILAGGQKEKRGEAIRPFVELAYRLGKSIR